MASEGVKLCLILALVMILYHRATAQSSCTSTLISLSPCLNYVTGNSSTPSSSCCSKLASVVQSQPQCLCTLVNGGGSSLGVNINQTLALSLPSACHLTTPPVSRCNDANSQPPATSPESSPESPPADSSSDTPSAPSSSIPAGSGSKTVPTTTTATSGGSIVKAPLHFVLLILFTAASSSTITKF